MVQKKQKVGKKSITLKDIFVHVQYVGQRIVGLEERMGGMEKRIGSMASDIQKLDKKIDGVEKKLIIRMDTLETNLTERINGLDADLTATQNDTIKIRKHVGMALPNDE